jgi:hypothetical protein
MNFFLNVLLFVLVSSRIIDAQKRIVNSTRISFVMEPFEEFSNYWMYDANWTLEVVNSTALFGEGSLKLQFFTSITEDEDIDGLDEEEQDDNESSTNATVARNRSTKGAFMWVLPKAPYNCYTSDSLSLWYKVQDAEEKAISMRLLLFDDTECVNTTNCAEEELTQQFVLEEELTDTDDWQELTFVWNDTDEDLPIHRIRGWRFEFDAPWRST